MANSAGMFRSNSAQRQAALRCAQVKRRRSLTAVPKLHQTRYVPIGGPMPPATQVVIDASRPVTFKTRVIFTGVPSGDLIRVGSGGTGISFVGGKLRAAVNGAYVDSAFSFVAGVRFDIALAIVPATGRFRAYIESTEIVDGQTAAGAYVSGGDLELLNAGMILDEGLRVYALHVPQEMHGAGTPGTPAFDDLLFRAAAHLMGADQLTPIHISTTP